MINGKKDKIFFLIYTMMKHLNCIGNYTSPWLGCVKGTLENCGLNSHCLDISKLKVAQGCPASTVLKEYCKISFCRYGLAEIQGR